MRLALLLALSSCASLNVGWAKVTWANGSVVPEAACSARVNGDGDVEMACVPLNGVQRDLLYKSEKRRATGGDT